MCKRGVPWNLDPPLGCWKIVPQDHCFTTRTVRLWQQHHWRQPPKCFLTGINGTIEHIFFLSAHHPKRSPAWSFPCHDLLRAGERIWFHIPWVNLGCAVRLQTAARGHFLHHKLILKANCVCENKEVVNKQVQGWLRSLSRTYSLTSHCPHLL